MPQHAENVICCNSKYPVFDQLHNKLWFIKFTFISNWIWTCTKRLSSPVCCKHERSGHVRPLFSALAGILTLSGMLRPPLHFWCGRAPWYRIVAVSSIRSFSGPPVQIGFVATGLNVWCDSDSRSFLRLDRLMRGHRIRFSAAYSLVLLSTDPVCKSRSFDDDARIRHCDFFSSSNSTLIRRRNLSTLYSPHTWLSQSSFPTCLWGSEVPWRESQHYTFPLHTVIIVHALWKRVCLMPEHYVFKNTWLCCAISPGLHFRSGVLL